MKSQLEKIIKQFEKQRIMVIGDVILDKYLWCAVEKLSPEAPVPVAHIQKTTYVLGGAANVANNLISLGTDVCFVGVTGEDSDADVINSLFAGNNIMTNGIFRDSSRCTTVKTRVIAGNYQLVRIDAEVKHDISGKLEARLFKFVEENLSRVRVVVFADYAKGAISNRLAQRIIRQANRMGVKVLADPTPTTFNKFKNVYLIKPNRRESERFLNRELDSDYANLEAMGKKIKAKLKAEVLIMTLGKDGMAIFNGDKGMTRIGTAAKEVFDVSGAGDSAMAAIAASIASGASLEDAAIIGNLCSGVVVGKLGTATCASDELVESLGHYE